MNTATLINKEDYSGAIVSLTINEDGSFACEWIKGLVKTLAPDSGDAEIDNEFSESIAEVTTDEGHSLTAYLIGKSGESDCWYCEDGDISRSGRTPQEAACKLFFNIV